MDDRELADRVLEHLDTDRATALSQEVCRIPSVLGEEGPLAKFLADVMKDAGFEAVDLQPVLPGPAERAPARSFGPGRRVVLTGHLDTKPVSHGWRPPGRSPATLIDGAVYGHGIMDMKAALACQIVAIEALARSGLPLAGTAGDGRGRRPHGRPGRLHRLLRRAPGRPVRARRADRQPGLPRPPRPLLLRRDRARQAPRTPATSTRRSTPTCWPPRWCWRWTPPATSPTCPRRPASCSAPRPTWCRAGSTAGCRRAARR